MDGGARRRADWVRSRRRVAVPERHGAGTDALSRAGGSSRLGRAVPGGDPDHAAPAERVGRLLVPLERGTNQRRVGRPRRGQGDLSRARCQVARRVSAAGLGVPKPGRLHDLPQPGGRVCPRHHRCEHEPRTYLRRDHGQPSSDAVACRAFPQRLATPVPPGRRTGRPVRCECGLGASRSLVSAYQLRGLPRPIRRRQLDDGTWPCQLAAQNAPHRGAAAARHIRHRQCHARGTRCAGGVGAVTADEPPGQGTDASVGFGRGRSCGGRAVSRVDQRDEAKRCVREELEDGRPRAGVE